MKNSKNIDIIVEETQTGSFNVGLSLGSLDGASFVSGLKENNINEVLKDFFDQIKIIEHLNGFYSDYDNLTRDTLQKVTTINSFSPAKMSSLNVGLLTTVSG